MQTAYNLQSSNIDSLRLLGNRTWAVYCRQPWRTRQSSRTALAYNTYVLRLGIIYSSVQWNC